MIILVRALAFAKGLIPLALGLKTRSLVSPLSMAVLAAFVGYIGWLKLIHDPKVARRTTQAIERKSDAAIAKARDAQSRVVVDGAADRLRRKYCPDCQ